MSRKIIFLLIYISLLNIVHAENISIYPNFIFSEKYNLTPSYSIIMLPDKNDVNPGDSINFKIYISGMGFINSHKINIFYIPELLDKNTPGIFISNIGCNYDTLTGKICPRDGYYSTPIYPKSSRLLIYLQNCLFMNDNINDNFNIPKIKIEEPAINYTSPISLNLNISNNAPTGDQTLDVIFTYSDGLKFYQDKKQVIIHINNPIERYSFIIASIIAIFAIFINLYINEIKKLIKKYKLIIIILIILIFYLIFKFNN